MKFMKKSNEARTAIMKNMADIAGQVFRLGRFRDSVKFRICKVKKLLEDWDLDFDAESDLSTELKDLQVTHMKVELQLAERRLLRYKMIEMLKKIDDETMEIRREYMRQKRELREKNCLVMKLERTIVGLKREIRQKEIVLEIKTDNMLKVAEEECLEIVKGRFNVD